MEDHAAASSRCSPSTSIRSRSSPSRALVERDIDLIAPMAAKNMARVYLSITTLDRDLARTLEPRAAAPERRLQAMRALQRRRRAGRRDGRAGDPAAQRPGPRGDPRGGGRARRAHARAGSCCACRSRVAPLFRDWLDEHYPLRAAHVMSLVQQLRGGRDYVAQFGDAHARHRRVRRPHREALRARRASGSASTSAGTRRSTRRGSGRRASTKRRASCSDRKLVRDLRHSQGDGGRERPIISRCSWPPSCSSRSARSGTPCSSAPWLAGIGKTMEQLTKDERRHAAAVRRRIPRHSGHVLHAGLDRAARHAAERGQWRADRRHRRASASIGATLALNYGFEARGVTLWLINAGYVFVGLVIAGAIIGAWRHQQAKARSLTSAILMALE